MLSFFRTNQLLTSLLLLPYALLLRAGGLGTPPPAGTLAWWAFNEGGWASPGVQYVGGAVLLALQGLYLNYLVGHNRLSREPSQLPGLAYVLVACLLPEFLGLPAPLLANTFLLLAYGQLCQTYKRAKAAVPLFNAGLWVGVASLCYSGYFLFLPWIFAGINSLRKPSLREWLVALLGLGCVYWLVSVGYTLWGPPPTVPVRWQQGFAVLDSRAAGGWTDWAKAGGWALLLSYLLTQASVLLIRKTIDVRKKINLLYVALLFSPLVLLLQRDLSLSALLLTTVPLGALLGLRWARWRPAVAEAVHLLLVAGVLLGQYWELF